MHFNPEDFGRAMGEAIAKAVEPLKQRIADLEKQITEMPAPKDGSNGKDGDAGRDGKDCDMEAVKALVSDLVKAIPVPMNGKDGTPGKDGAPGADGKSISADDVLPAIKAQADAFLKALPIPKDGRDGIDGKSFAIEDARPIIEEAVKSIREESRHSVEMAVKSIPVPKDGRDGRDGIDGKDGTPGEKGADGAGVSDLLIDRAGELIATMTDGRMKNLGPVIGKDGRDGADGKDGFSLESFELEYLEETHEIRIKAACADRAKEIRFPAGGIRPAGYWRDGSKAKAGEVYTHDGSAWVAKCDTSARPDPANKTDWVLLARKGRDGETVVKKVSTDPAPPIKLKKDDDESSDK